MRNLFLSVLLGACLLGCTPTEKPALPVSGNAVYYWRTTFAPDSAERSFLATYDVRRIYCRYFDVVMDSQGQPVPNATIELLQPVPGSVEIVPTVFIMNDCMQRPSDSLATRIVRRIVQMNATNDIEGVREIQIDCDYTARNRETYYRFLSDVRRLAWAEGMWLSVTIRLHQLSMPVPPADYGVLMLYNTGAPERFAERNPILDIRDVKPYIRHLKAYGLPLAAAYPVFRWQRTLHGVEISHEAAFRDILLTKQAVEAERDDVRQLILTYHLSNENIQRYKPDQYETLYHH